MENKYFEKVILSQILNGKLKLDTKWKTNILKK